ncbi:acetyltransferase [Microbacterium paludicola]|uniref:acetyltransferase n=1 Tax=Microbacterium paludicola TaxID=300019 RepID=UPI0038790B41
MTRLIIAGSGGHGRELLAWVQTSPLFRQRHSVVEVGFINDGDPAVPLEAPLLGSIRDFVPAEGDALICGIGDPKDRAAVTERLEARGARFVSFIHDEAVVGPTVRHGRGLVAVPRVTVSTDVVLGAHVLLNVGSAVHHDAMIGDYVTMSPGSTALGWTAVGDFAYIGAGATVLPRLTVGAGATVGAMAAVTSNVPEDTVVAGVPATTLRPRD